MLWISLGYTMSCCFFFFLTQPVNGYSQIYFYIVGLLWKVDRGIAALLWKTQRSIDLPLTCRFVYIWINEWQIFIFWVLTILVSTLQVSTKTVIKILTNNVILFKTSLCLERIYAGSAHSKMIDRITESEMVSRVAKKLLAKNKQ